MESQSESTLQKVSENSSHYLFKHKSKIFTIFPINSNDSVQKNLSLTQNYINCCVIRSVLKAAIDV